jgi:hypothetical protein
MKPDEQLRVQERMRVWVSMTPDERRQVRENFARAQKVAPSKKSTDWENYQQLPDEQKKQLAARSANKKQLANLATPSQSKQQQLAAPLKPHVPPPPPATPVPPPAPWLEYCACHCADRTCGGTPASNPARASGAGHARCHQITRPLPCQPSNAA